MQKGDIKLDFVSTEMQLADIFTKPLSEDRFCMIRRELGTSNLMWSLMNFNDLHVICV